MDLGLTDVVYNSEGNKINNPRHLKKHSEKLALLQRKISNKKKNSNNRNKARLKLTRQYEKLTNARNNFLHKLSRCYINNYDAIGMEDLQINNMVHNKYLSKSILDASWGKLRQLISYKAENAGKLFITVNPNGTTQRCSQCGKLVKKTLAIRIHKCSCGFEAPRDYNSALEIKNLCLQKIGQELSESMLVEMKALPFQGQLSSMKQETISLIR